MKRHKSLMPVSRQHHEILILAQLLKNDVPDYKGLPDSVEGKREYALNFFRLELAGHFELEETILLPFVIGRNEEIDLLCENVIGQHKKIAGYFELIRNERNVEKNMDELGKLLSEHIRLEERELLC